MPGFGVQLETQYRSGRIIRRFVPSSKILKPVLNECVTPVTCYWSLSLIIHGEEQLLVVFKELRPPVKTLVPIWKALCASIECGEHIHE
nr:Phosphatidylinositol N-acetylglucosaminyltransferase subunit H like [Ipomoea batatas]